MPDKYDPTKDPDYVPHCQNYFALEPWQKEQLQNAHQGQNQFTTGSWEGGWRPLSEGPLPWAGGIAAVLLALFLFSVLWHESKQVAALKLKMQKQPEQGSVPSS
jgi:hypothetical protein